MVEEGRCSIEALFPELDTSGAAAKVVLGIPCSSSSLARDGDGVGLVVVEEPAAEKRKTSGSRSSYG